jgi:hypothetical protein
MHGQTQESEFALEIANTSTAKRVSSVHTSVPLPCEGLTRAHTQDLKHMTDRDLSHHREAGSLSRPTATRRAS